MDIRLIDWINDKCAYSKCNGDQNVIICLYVDGMLMFCTNLKQVEDTKEFLLESSKLLDMGETNVILSIKIVREQESITLSQSHYIEKVLKKFNHYDCMLATIPFDPSMKLTINNSDSI